MLLKHIGSTIIENMCNSMRSSRQMAEECMQEDNYGDQGEEEVYTHRNVLPDSNSCDMIAGTIDNSKLNQLKLYIDLF